MKSALRKQLSVIAQRRLLSERRSNKRVVPAHRTFCMIQPCGEDERSTGLVHNISRTGVAVHVERAYALGASLRVLLVNEAHTFSLTMDLKVSRLSAAGDRYLLAGHFARPLLHTEIAPFIL